MLAQLDARKRKFLTFQIPSQFTDVEAKIRKIMTLNDMNTDFAISNQKQGIASPIHIDSL